MAVELSHEYSDKQSVILSSAATAVCTNPNLNSASPKTAFNVAKALEIGGSYWTTEVTTALVGASVLTASLVTKAADASLSSGATVIASVEFPATSVIGTKRMIKLAPGTERLAYLGVLYLSTGAKITAGNVNSRLGTAGAVTD